jgi:membrane protein implicated in regulation of membrane protease activity
MQTQSASALVWTAVILGFLGLVIASPAGRIFLSVCAALFALPPATFGRKTPQAAGTAVLILSLTLAAASYPRFKKANDDYIKRSGDRSAKPERDEATMERSRVVRAEDGARYTTTIRRLP